MPGQFSVHVDPDELAAQSVAAAFQHEDEKDDGRSDRPGRSGAPSAAPRGKVGRGGAQSAAQPRKYAFRRS